MSLALLLETELRTDVDAGLDVHGISAPGPYVEQVTSIGVRHVGIDALTRAWEPRHDMAAFRALRHAFRQLELDILHTHNPKTGVLGRIAGRLARIPVVVNTCHGLWAGPQDRLRRRAFVYGLEGFAGLFSDAELYQNQQDHATLHRVVGSARGRVVGNGVDLERFRFDAAGRARVRAELDVSPDQLLVGCVGRRVAEKGMHEFAAAAKALSSRACFVWVGPPDQDKADAVTTEAADVTYVPARFDMPAVYSALDVFVLPSYREGFSRSAMEAAACGRAMVLSNIRGCREIGADGRELMLVAPRDATALTSAVSGLLADAGERERLAAAAATRARHAFDQRMVAAASLETYAAIARRKNLGWEIDAA